MKMFNRHSRRAISPIVATVLIVAVTLVASVAIAGFVFGIFASQGNTAQIAVTGTALKSTDFTSVAGATARLFSCLAAGSSAITVTNTGSAGAYVTGVSLNWAGQTATFSIIAAEASNAANLCNVGPAGTTTATFKIQFATGQNVFGGANGVTAAVGGSFTGTVTTSNGAVLLYAGTFTS